MEHLNFGDVQRIIFSVENFIGNTVCCAALVRLTLWAVGFLEIQLCVRLNHSALTMCCVDLHLSFLDILISSDSEAVSSSYMAMIFQEGSVCLERCQRRRYRLCPLFCPYSLFTPISMLYHVSMVTGIPGWPHLTTRSRWVIAVASHCPCLTHTHTLILLPLLPWHASSLITPPILWSNFSN